VYGKVFGSIYDGTLYGHWEAIVTMQQMIVLADPNGVVDMTVAAISARTSIPKKIIEKGIGFLEEPDPFSRTPGEDGRRIVLMDEHRPWGWRLVNHWKYMKLRNMEQKREADRVRMSEKRNEISNVAIGSQSVANVAHKDIDKDIDKDKNNNGRAVALPDWLPVEPWSAWLEVRSRNRAPNTPRALRLAITELAKLKAAGQDIQAVLEQSTLRGWRGVFAIKGDKSIPDYSAVMEKIRD
jgi:hypothetical protein